MSISEIEIPSSSNYKININIYSPKETKAIIIYLHGFGSSKDNKTSMQLFEKLSKENISLITFNFPLHGNSKSENLTITNCLNDFISVENYIKEKYEKIPIGIFGTSLGAYIILLRINLLEKNNYFTIILKSPALKLDEIFINHLLNDSFINFKNNGFSYSGISKKIKVPFIFYEELLKNKLFNIYHVDYPMLIIQGNKDEISPFDDTLYFVNNINKNAILQKIENGDHRFMGSGQIEKCLNLAFDYILKCLNNVK